MGRRFLLASISVGLIAVAAIAVAQDSGTIDRPPVGDFRHGRHIWIVLGRSNNTGTGDPTEDLKAFNHAIAVQATSEQVTLYDSLVELTEAANRDVQALMRKQEKQTGAVPLSGSISALDEAVRRVHGEAQRFLDSFSTVQRMGLRELPSKLAKTDSDLARQANLLNAKVGDPSLDAQQVTSYANNLDHLLATVRDEQSRLGNEMGIQDVSDGQEISFDLPPLRSSIEIEKRPIAIAIDGTMSRATGQSGFRLELTADASDLQQNIVGILRSRLNKSDGCGERLAVQWASLAAQARASLAVVQLHLERWTCIVSPGNPRELAEGNGEVEVKVTPTVTPTNLVRLSAEIDRVNAPGMIADQIRSGSLGAALREAVTQALSPAVDSEMDFKTMLPPVAQGDAVIEKAEFREAGGLHVVLTAKIPISDQQLPILATQLKSRLPAQDALHQ